MFGVRVMKKFLYKKFRKCGDQGNPEKPGRETFTPWSDLGVSNE